MVVLEIETDRLKAVGSPISLSLQLLLYLVLYSHNDLFCSRAPLDAARTSRFLQSPRSHTTPGPTDSSRSLRRSCEYPRAPVACNLRARQSPSHCDAAPLAPLTVSFVLHTLLYCAFRRIRRIHHPPRPSAQPRRPVGSFGLDHPFVSGCLHLHCLIAPPPSTRQSRPWSLRSRR